MARTRLGVLLPISLLTAIAGVKTQVRHRDLECYLLCTLSKSLVGCNLVHAGSSHGFWSHEELRQSKDLQRRDRWPRDKSLSHIRRAQSW